MKKETEMTVKELKEKLQDVPDDAMVKCETKYGKHVTDIEYTEDYVYCTTYKTLVLK